MHDACHRVEKLIKIEAILIKKIEPQLKRATSTPAGIDIEVLVQMQDKLTFEIPK